MAELRSGITVEPDVEPFTNEAAAFLRGMDGSGHVLMLRLTRSDLDKCMKAVEKWEAKQRLADEAAEPDGV